MMLNKINTLNKLIDNGVVAVIRGNDEEAYHAAKACIEGGVKAIELTFTIPNVVQVIRKLVMEYQSDNSVIIGAGTVLDVVSAKLAIDAGAKFIVSPSFSKDVAMECNLFNIPYTPGVMTPTEIQTALSYGADIVKIFPGSVVKPAMVSAVHGPFPQANIMPSGGVSAENMEEWFNAGVVVVGAGSNLTKPASMGDYEQVKKNAEDYHKKFLEIRKGL